MKKIVKLPLLLLPVCMFMTNIVACGGNNNNSSSSEENHYTPKEYKYKEIFHNNGEFKFDIYDDLNPDNCTKLTYKINQSIGAYNYIKIALTTDCNLVGWIKYCDENDPSKTNEEKFYIEAGKTEFCQFLDAFRFGAFGAFENKRVLSLSFQSVDSEKEGTMEFKGLYISNREYFKERMYIDDGTIKIGTSVSYGGSIEWLERIDINVVEYIDAGGYTRIDKDIDPNMIEPSRLISANVNVVNIFDLGREIQPSYYLSVDKEKNGYNPLTPYAYESLSGSPSYNPIQCGGVGDIPKGIVTGPQVIDYEYDSEHIYIKTKGQDWMFVNDQAQGYIEATYKFGEDGLLIVENRYTDFYQFRGLNSAENPMAGQECPATYFVYPFNYFYCQTKSRTIYDPYVGDISNGHTPIETPSTSIPAVGSYYYAIKAAYMKNNCDWVAYVNDQKFGAGIYMPNADYYIGSRGSVSTSYKDRGNCTYTDRFFDFGDGLTPSYAASNYCYINPQLRRRMVEFVPLEYTYALFIGDVNEMSEAFENAKMNGLDNENLTMSENTWPKH